jgi:regulator of cell morphogenesis and NO signaling
MSLTAETTVRDLAVENPGATRLFEKLGIDYCCGGGKSLAEACDKAQLSVTEVLHQLTLARAAGTAPGAQLHDAPLAELIAHIVRTHHQFTRSETARIAALFDRVSGKHGQRHPELLDLRDTFAGLSQELQMHLMKEENILFPYIARMEAASAAHERAVPPPFGTVQNPVSMMMQEHDSAGEALAILRERSHNYMAPEDACISYRTLYEALAGFEADLHQHIHLENNVLFPKAIAMEKQARG